MYTVFKIHKRLQNIIKNTKQENLYKELEVFRLEIIIYERKVAYEKVFYLKKKLLEIKGLLFRL
jgi:hypothetical protein